MVEAKRHLNSRTPVSQLPPELLDLIFLEIKHEYLDILESHEGFFFPFDSVGSELWNNEICHVCHQWREIALANAKLWTRVVSSPTNNEWTQEMLIRSRNQLLITIIEKRLDSDTSDTSIAGRCDLLRQLSRCHTLSMRFGSFEELYEVWPSKLVAPKLDHLVVCVDPPLNSKAPFILSDSLLEATSLRRLEVRYCGMNWKSRFLNGLTHLGLDLLSVESQLTCPEFIKALAAMPSLQELCLYYGGVLDDDGSANPGIPPTSDVAHPTWQSLEVTDDLVNTARFLGHISLAPTCRIHFTSCETLAESELPLQSILRWIQNHFKQSADGPSQLTPRNVIRSFRFNELQGYLSLLGYNEVLRDEEPRNDEALFGITFLTLLFEELTPYSRANGSFFLKCLPLDCIVVLYLCLPSFCLSSSTWATTLGTIPTLETIQLHVGEPMSFFQALLPSDQTDVPFRALESLSLLASMTLTAEENHDLSCILDQRQKCQMPIRLFHVMTL